MVYARSAIVGVEVYKGSNSVDSLKKEKRHPYEWGGNTAFCYFQVQWCSSNLDNQAL